MEKKPTSVKKTKSVPKADKKTPVKKTAKKSTEKPAKKTTPAKPTTKKTEKKVVPPASKKQTQKRKEAGTTKNNKTTKVTKAKAPKIPKELKIRKPKVVMPLLPSYDSMEWVVCSTSKGINEMIESMSWCKATKSKPDGLVLFEQDGMFAINSVRLDFVNTLAYTDREMYRKATARYYYKLNTEKFKEKY